MREIKTIEVDKWVPSEKKGMVKHAGMVSPQEAFYALKKHLENVGLMPDEYFNSNDWQWNDVKELPDYIRASCDVNWGGSEGIYIDISLLHKENNEIKRFPFATGKTLGRSGDDFLKMSRIAAECSMMLNGRGDIVRVSENVYENLSLTEQEKELVVKALDAMGDKVADSEGYSAGEEYWSLKEKFGGVGREENVVTGKDEKTPLASQIEAAEEKKNLSQESVKPEKSVSNER